MRFKNIFPDKKQKFMRSLVATTFMVTFQAYLVAPLIPELAHDLNASRFAIGFSIPAFAIPFGLSSFISSVLLEQTDRKKMLRALLAIVAAVLILLSLSRNGTFFLNMRVIIGFLTGGLVQLSVSTMGEITHPGERDKSFSYLILAHAAGMTFGPTFGACFYPVIGWRLEFIILAIWTIFCTFLQLPE